MQLFYNQEITITNKTFFFNKEESKHIIKVLRKKDTDILHVTNGLGALFVTEITLASDTKCTVKIVSVEIQEKSKFEIHLAVAPTKLNDRYEWFLEKATEIGVTTITPIICEHSERKFIKTDRFEKIIQTAMKQSNQYFLPILNEPMTFGTFVGQNFLGQKLIAHCELTNKKSIKEVLELNKSIIILIGPEGDFSNKEIQQAFENNFVPITLGKTRLRTETAAILACHSVVYMNE